MTMRLCAGLVAGFACFALLTQLAPSFACPLTASEGESFRVRTAAEVDQAVEQLLREFKTLYKAGKYHEAEEMALKARRLDPKGGLSNAALFLARRQLTTVKGKRRIEEDEKALQRRLDSFVAVYFENTPLERVLHELRESHGINIVPDVPALQEAGISMDSPISLKHDGLWLKSVLHLILDQKQLTWKVENATVMVTTPERARGKLTAVTYAVADLVVPVTQAVGAKAPVATKEAELIKLITSTIYPRSWSDMGGPCTIDYFPLTMSLVINQTPDIHEQIQDLLAAQRRLQDVQVVIELRFVTVSEERFKKLAITPPGKSNPTPYQAQILDDKQVHRLLEAAQLDQSAVVTQAPKVTCFNGQEVTLDVTDKVARLLGEAESSKEKGRCRSEESPVEAGFRATIQPVAWIDRDGARINLSFDLTRPHPTPLTRPLNCGIDFPTQPEQSRQRLHYIRTTEQPRFSTYQGAATLSIPDGKTALLSHIGNPFGTKGQKEHLLVLVTARVIVQEEEEVNVAVPEKHHAKEQPKPDVIVDEQPKPQPGKEIPPAAPAKVIHANSKSFHLCYGVDNVGPSKLAGIDVYYTRDGKHWDRHPEPVKPIGSFPVTVGQEGRYGFRLVAKSGAGLAKPAPKAGDEPHLWVEVDTTRPDAELYAPQYSDDNPRHIQLQWKASDRNLDDEPVSLEYAATPDGPWHPIGEARMPNTGRHDWAMPKDLPGKIYLRLTVRDKAGNAAVATTPRPVLIDNLVPEVRDVQFGIKPAILQ